MKSLRIYLWVLMSTYGYDPKTTTASLEFDDEGRPVLVFETPSLTETAEAS